MRIDGWKKILLGGFAIASMPLTCWALIYDDAGEFANYVSIGYYNYYSSSSSSTPAYWNCDGSGLLIVGGGNQANNYQTAALIGQYLINYQDNALVVGEWNQVTDNAYFVVGNGTSSTPSDAIVVYKNGDVVIPKQQGDISMGIFGN